MKARKIITRHKYGKTYDHIFKHYSNALEFRMRIRANNLKERNPYHKVKMSRIEEIEVADDYWKKDFGGGYSFKFTSNGLKGEGYKKHTEVEYLSLQLGMFKEHELIRLDYKNPDVKFMKEDIEWIQHAKFPKNEETQQFRDCSFSCWRLLRKMGKEHLFGEQMRGMYEDEFNEYCEKMDKLQKELVAEMQ